MTKPIREYDEYDENGNLIRSEDSDGFLYWHEYDKKGNLIRSERSKWYGYWRNFVPGSLLGALATFGTLYLGESHGSFLLGFIYMLPIWTLVAAVLGMGDYDENGIPLPVASPRKEFVPNSVFFGVYLGILSMALVSGWTHPILLPFFFAAIAEGTEMTNIIRDTIREYDEKGNLIHSKDSKGYEKWKEYDENGKLIYSERSKGYEYWRNFVLCFPLTALVMYGSLYLGVNCYLSDFGQNLLYQCVAFVLLLSVCLAPRAWILGISFGILSMALVSGWTHPTLLIPFVAAIAVVFSLIKDFLQGWRVERRIRRRLDF